MSRRLRTIVQIASLVLFIVLLKAGRAQDWMKVVLATVVLAIPFGRFYCGWICPTNTLMRVSDWIGKKLKVKVDRIPKVLRPGWVPYVLLVLLVASFVLNARRGVKLPFIVILSALAFVLTLRYRPEVWHRYLCPFGVLYGVTGRFALLSMRVNERCTGCGLCRRVCPGEAVTIESNRASIGPQYCLECLDCIALCRRDAITYGLPSGEVGTPVSPHT